MTTSWNSNTIRAGKWLALTLAALLIAAVSPVLREYALALGALVAFVTTYQGVSAVRCEHAQRRDVWAGIAITLVAAAIGIFSIVRLMNL